MGLRRFVSSMLRRAPLRSSKPGELAAGCPSVFTEDGMWTAMVHRQQQVISRDGPVNTKANGCEHQSGSASTTYRLPRKRCWLTKQNGPEFKE